MNRLLEFVGAICLAMPIALTVFYLADAIGVGLRRCARWALRTRVWKAFIWAAWYGPRMPHRDPAMRAGEPAVSCETDECLAITLLLNVLERQQVRLTKGTVIYAGNVRCCNCEVCSCERAR